MSCLLSTVDHAAAANKHLSEYGFALAKGIKGSVIEQGDAVVAGGVDQTRGFGDVTAAHGIAVPADQARSEESELSSGLR